MILTRLSTLLRERQRASLAELACGVDASPEALQPMLATLERKGRIRHLGAGSRCSSGCCKCDPATLDVYEWIADAAAD